jgi:uncharacterized protein YndB with AHSA1/START domain
MTAPAEAVPTSDRELVLTRIIDAPREKLFRAWTDAELLKQWFAPLPYTTPVAELDVRPGGANLVVMRSPDGKDLPNRGVYLEVVENERLVFTDAYTKAWEPSQKPFMTVILTFEDEGGGKTRYTARVRHWTVADREAHEEMGFHGGWGLCTDQLAALAARLLRSLATPQARYASSSRWHRRVGIARTRLCDPHRMRQRNAHVPLSAWAKSLARLRRKLPDLGMRFCHPTELSPL